MPTKYNNIKRLLQRAAEELRATADIAKATSIIDAAATFVAKIDIQVMNRNGFRETPAVKRRLMRKHKVMLRCFEEKFSDFTQNYDFDRPLGDCPAELQNRIWVCWWQGLDQAPEIVKACVESIRKHAGDRTLTIITEENYKNYVSVPAWIEEKYRAGIITRTNYSDLLRLSLLAQYGGIWLDATFFCTGEIVADKPLWSIKRPDYLHGSVAGGYFAGYSLGCDFDSRWIFATIRDFFLHYWAENDRMIDYLLIDYMIVLAQRLDPRIQAAFDRIEPNQPDCDELVKLLGKPFDEEKWQEIKKDTTLFKLTWKQAFPEQADEEDTFYKKLVDGKLE